jgi:hypothetical protein
VEERERTHQQQPQPPTSPEEHEPATGKRKIEDVDRYVVTEPQDQLGGWNDHKARDDGGDQQGPDRSQRGGNSRALQIVSQFGGGPRRTHLLLLDASLPQSRQHQ